jgi:chromosome partitioning protein
MKTIAVLSRKGGSGKTTVAVSLAVAARQTGLKVVLADIDPLRSAGVVLGARSEAASLLLETAGKRLRAVRDAARRSGCDLLIIDTPPAPESEVQKAIEIADLCVAVTRPSPLDLAAVQQTIATIRKSGRRGMIVLNQCQSARAGAETTLTRKALDTLQSGALSVAGVRLRSRSAYQHAFSQAQGVTEWDRGRQAAEDILRLLAEISTELQATQAQPREGRRPWLGYGEPQMAAGHELELDESWRLNTAANVRVFAESWL